MDFQKIFQHIPETIVVLSPEYKVLAATDEYLKATMRSREELIGQDFLKAFPDNPDKSSSKNEHLLRDSLNRALTGKKIDFLNVLRYDIPRPESQGGGFEIRYWEASHTPVLDEANNVMYIIQRTADVTEREIAKLALSESEDKFRFMAEAMPQLIHTYNSKGELTYFNQRWINYTGITNKDLLDINWQRVIHPDDYPVIIARYEKGFRENKEFQAEIRLRDKDGSYRWHLSRTLPMHDDAGNVIMWVSSATDIHDTRQMVEELLTANEQMSLLSDQVQLAFQKAEYERQTLERLIMEIPAIFCILKGPNHVFELVNPRYQQLFPDRELLHHTVADALPEVIEQGFINILDNVYNSGETFTAEEILIKLDRSNSGNLEDVYFNLIYQPLYEEEKITGILVFGYEVTEQVRFRQELDKLRNV